MGTLNGFSPRPAVQMRTLRQPPVHRHTRTGQKSGPKGPVLKRGPPPLQQGRLGMERVGWDAPSGQSG